MKFPIGTKVVVRNVQVSYNKWNGINLHTYPQLSGTIVASDKNRRLITFELVGKSTWRDAEELLLESTWDILYGPNKK